MTSGLDGGACGVDVYAGGGGGEYAGAVYDVLPAAPDPSDADGISGFGLAATGGGGEYADGWFRNAVHSGF